MSEHLQHDSRGNSDSLKKNKEVECILHTLHLKNFIIVVNGNFKIQTAKFSNSLYLIFPQPIQSQSPSSRDNIRPHLEINKFEIHGVGSDENIRGKNSLSAFHNASKMQFLRLAPNSEQAR